jgi:alkanesulfonate monooxygenase SsuD/methylene tetrahydromethanopterin reductase-like flavin-dependent oxidoreductase (luciferase family)
VITVGIDVHESVLAFGPEDRRALFRRIADAGLDHVTVADHVSFHGGTGFDGMVSAAAALATGDRLDVWISVYQLALRHPLAVARQLASLAQIGPGRLVFGVGVGGEDRSEVEAGCRHITLVANATGWQQAVDHTGEVKQRLIEACG